MDLFRILGDETQRFDARSPPRSNFDVRRLRDMQGQFHCLFTGRLVLTNFLS